MAPFDINERLVRTSVSACRRGMARLLQAEDGWPLPLTRDGASPFHDTIAGSTTGLPDDWHRAMEIVLADGVEAAQHPPCEELGWAGFGALGATFLRPHEPARLPSRHSGARGVAAGMW